MLLLLRKNTLPKCLNKLTFVMSIGMTFLQVVFIREVVGHAVNWCNVLNLRIVRSWDKGTYYLTGVRPDVIGWYHLSMLHNCCNTWHDNEKSGYVSKQWHTINQFLEASRSNVLYCETMVSLINIRVSLHMKTNDVNGIIMETVNNTRKPI